MAVYNCGSRGISASRDKCENSWSNMKWAVHYVVTVDPLLGHLIFDHTQFTESMSD